MPGKKKAGKAASKPAPKSVKTGAKKAKPAKAAKAAKPAPVKTAAKPAAKPVKKAAPKAAPAPKSAAPAASAFKPALDALAGRFEKEIRLCRSNDLTLGKRIDEVGEAGERILDEIDALRREIEALRGGALSSKVGRLEEAVKTMQADLTKAAAQNSGIVKELKKAMDCVDDLRDGDSRCNAGPLIDRAKDFEGNLSVLQVAVDSMRTSIEALAVELVSKVNELAAKFNMHSHFLKARNNNQDLFFHVDNPEGAEAALPEAPRTLGVKPVRTSKEPSAAEVDLRLTPPRHWEDPLIWFGNVGPVERKE